MKLKKFFTSIAFYFNYLLSFIDVFNSSLLTRYLLRRSPPRDLTAILIDDTKLIIYELGTKYEQEILVDEGEDWVDALATLTIINPHLFFHARNSQGKVLIASPSFRTLALLVTTIGKISILNLPPFLFDTRSTVLFRNLHLKYTKTPEAFYKLVMHNDDKTS